MVTLREVAQEAGVSSATASRALAGSSSVNEVTRAKIAAVARRRGYRVNAVARSLRTQRTDTIGLLLPDIRNPFFTDLAYAIDKCASSHGLTVMLGSADEQAVQQDRYLDALARHQVDGIIAVPQGEPSEALRQTSANIPTVFVDRDPGIADVPCITSDNEGGLELLVDHVVGLGHRRIGVVAGPQSTSTGRARLAAVRSRLAHHGLALNDRDVVEGDFRLESGVKATDELLDRGSYQAIIAADNLMALGALMVIRRRGLAVGAGLALACVDDLEWFSLVDPPVTVVAQDIPALGRAAVDSLLARIKGGSVASCEVPMNLIVRSSCGEGHMPATPDCKEAEHG